MFKKIRQLIINTSYNSKVGHISSHLSICDLIWCLYDSVLDNKPEYYKINNINNSEKLNKNRDRFILSKGHAALALYVTLFLKGFITKEQLENYAKNNTYLPLHPKDHLSGVEFSTGSLGQGITFACGYVLSAKIEASNRKTYCLISDGEINEGSCWESFMFIKQHNLNNLILIYDNNKLQCMGNTKNIIDNESINKKMEAFGFDIFEIDGNNHEEIKKTYLKISTRDKNQKPVFINAHTIAGKGVSFMENELKWHYNILTENDLSVALKELI